MRGCHSGRVTRGWQTLCCPGCSTCCCFPLSGQVGSPPSLTPPLPPAGPPCESSRSMLQRQGHFVMLFCGAGDHTWTSHMLCACSPTELQAQTQNMPGVLLEEVSGDTGNRLQHSFWPKGKLYKNSQPSYLSSALYLLIYLSI